MSTPQWARANNQGPRGGIGTGLLIGLAAFVLLGFVGRVVSAALPRTEAQLERDFDRYVDGSEQGAVAFRALRSDFPEHYATVRRQVATDLRSGMSQEEAGRRGFMAMRKITSQVLPQAAAAPDAELVAFAVQSRELIEHLQATDPQLCADYGMRGFKPGTTFPPATFIRIEQLVAAQIHLGKAGAQARVTRRAIGERDFPDLGRTMLANGADEALLVKMDGGARASAAEECRYAVALYRAVDAMPDKESARWTSFLLLETAKAMAAAPAA